MPAAVLRGAELCLPPTDLVPAAHQVLSWMAHWGITMLHTVPTVLGQWLHDPPPGISLADLRLLFVAGEPLHGALVDRWRTVFGHRAKIVNLYGPTETTLAKCSFVVPTPARPGVQPLGRAMRGAQVWVAGDDPAAACGVGEPGEILIRTPNRTRGYLNAADEQRTRFVPNPQSSNPADLIYRTGDIGRLTAEGMIEFLGRNDHQIKIRGVRIELGEIESTLVQHPGVEQCVVTVVDRNDPPGDRQLAAYLTFNGGQPIQVEQLRRDLSARLPAYMSPAFFVTLDALPRTPNGKVDRAALPEPDMSGANRMAQYVAPRTEVEQRLVMI